MENLHTSKVLIRRNCFTTKGHEGFAKDAKQPLRSLILTSAFMHKHSDLEGFD
jgi:hypothetical protein